MITIETKAGPLPVDMSDTLGAMLEELRLIARDDGSEELARAYWLSMRQLRRE